MEGRLKGDGPARDLTHETGAAYPSERYDMECRAQREQRLKKTREAVWAEA